MTVATVRWEDDNYLASIDVNGKEVEIEVPVCIDVEVDLIDYFDEHDCIRAHTTKDLLAYMCEDAVFDYLIDKIEFTESRMEQLLLKLGG